MRRKRFTLPTPEQTAKHRADVIRGNRAARQRSRKLLENLKQGPCMDCGVQYPHYVMDFDHVRGVKVSGLAELAGKSRAPKVMLAEVAKCDLVCANCHRERT